MSKKFIGAAIVAGMLFDVALSDAVAADSRKPSAMPEVNGVDQTDIARLVRELGASTYMTRQQAQRALVALGLKARPALELASRDQDLEVQRRAKAALASIDNVDFYVRLAKFLDDENVDAGHGLAGWNRYCSIAGTSSAARRLFADMQRAEHDLLAAVERSPEKSGRLLEARCQQAETMNQSGDGDRQALLSLGTVAAIVFAASDTDVPVSQHAAECINRFTNQKSLIQSLDSRPMLPVVRSLLGAWVGRPFDRDSVTSYNNLLMAMTYNLKEGLPVALRLIEPPRGPPIYEQYAILAVGRLGGREHLSALAPLLEDERPLGLRNRGGHESDTQIRDVALAVMVQLTGQKLTDYGFSHAKTHPLYLFASNTLGFNDPAARGTALKKWREWSEKQPK